MRGRAPGVTIVLRSGVRRAPILAKRDALSGWRGGRGICQRPAYGHEQRYHRSKKNSEFHFRLLSATPAAITAQKAAQEGAPFGLEPYM
jgi:hypothetical protein